MIKINEHASVSSDNNSAVCRKHVAAGRKPQKFNASSGPRAGNKEMFHDRFESCYLLLLAISILTSRLVSERRDTNVKQEVGVPRGSGAWPITNLRPRRR